MYHYKKGFMAQKSAFIFGFFVLTAFVLGCSAAPKPAAFTGPGNPGDPVPFMESVRTGTLPSGLR